MECRNPTHYALNRDSPQQKTKELIKHSNSITRAILKYIEQNALIIETKEFWCARLCAIMVYDTLLTAPHPS